MSASNIPPKPAIVAADPSQPFTPRALISEVLRTCYCIPGSILLVENIEVNIPVSKRYRTVRLLLGDGKFCIQALLRTEMHRFVDSGQVFEGCYVQLSKFEIQSVQLRPDQQGDVDGTEGPAEMVFLVVLDMATVGWNTDYMEMAGTTGQEQALFLADPGETGDYREAEPGVAQGNAAPTELPDTEPPLAAPKEVYVADVDEADEDDDFEVMIIPEQRASDRCRQAELIQQQQQQQQQQQPSRLASYSASNSNSNSHTRMPVDLSKPLRLTPLKSIPNLPYKQNWAVNVLAIVASLSDVEPALLPSYVGKQRTARLADPSTGKQVLLTVFLEPDEFAPAVGSVVLLLGVKNHRFDGGSLKKYGNEKPRDGDRWWYENPTDIAWCDVESLRVWWKRQSL